MLEPQLPKPWDDQEGEEEVYAILEHEAEYGVAVGDECEEIEEIPATAATRRIFTPKERCLALRLVFGKRP